MATHVGTGYCFVQIHRKYHAFLRCYLRRLGVSSCDSDDIIQETFLRSYKLLTEAPDADHRPLLARIAKNLRIDSYRRQKHFPLHDSPEFPDAPDPIEDRRETALKVQLAELIEELDQADALFFKLHYSNGHSMQEIAHITESPLGLVSGRIYRFREKFLAANCQRLEDAAALAI